ncbi:hypothetical protein TNCV_5048101 [Trichonephila clavipes]|nr:hypothetical protein TNCV_5048101 [Trichonephila clavipes]
MNSGSCSASDLHTQQVSLRRDSQSDGQNVCLVKHFLGQPYLSPIDHVWNMMRRQLHLPGNNDNLVGKFVQICKKHRRKLSVCFITLSPVVWQIVSKLEWVNTFLSS